MTTRTTSPKTRPWDVEAVPDLFGVWLHLDGRQFHVSKERLIPVLEALSYWLVPSDAETKSFLMKLATQHGIYTEDLFPGDQDG